MISLTALKQETNQTTVVDKPPRLISQIMQRLLTNPPSRSARLCRILSVIEYYDDVNVCSQCINGVVLTLYFPIILLLEKVDDLILDTDLLAQAFNLDDRFLVCLLCCCILFGSRFSFFFFFLWKILNIGLMARWARCFANRSLNFSIPFSCCFAQSYKSSFFMAAAWSNADLTPPLCVSSRSALFTRR